MISLRLFLLLAVFCLPAGELSAQSGLAEENISAGNLVWQAARPVFKAFQQFTRETAGVSVKNHTSQRVTLKKTIRKHYQTLARKSSQKQSGRVMLTPESGLHDHWSVVSLIEKQQLINSWRLAAEARKAAEQVIGSYLPLEALATTVLPPVARAQTVLTNLSVFWLGNRFLSSVLVLDSACLQATSARLPGANRWPQTLVLWGSLGRSAWSVGRNYAPVRASAACLAVVTKPGFAPGAFSLNFHI